MAAPLLFSPAQELHLEVVLVAQVLDTEDLGRLGILHHGGDGRYVGGAGTSQVSYSTVLAIGVREGKLRDDSWAAANGLAS